MIDWRLVVSLGLASASMAACLGYLMSPPWQVQATKPPPLAVLTNVQEAPVLNQSARPLSADEQAVADFEAAADEILRKAPNTRASAAFGVPWHDGNIPLPRRRPLGAP